MPFSFKALVTAVIAAGFLPLLCAQDLAPRAYVITPVHSNAVTATYSFYDGSLLFNGTLPITDATGQVNLGVVTLYHALNFLGRSSNITASLPYGIGNFQGTLMKTQTSVYRSGLFDSTFRFSVNLMGGPAMDAKEMSQWKQKTLLGVSLKVVAPTGQYYPTKLINYGANRWGFKPELGLSQRWGHWVLDTYAGVWLFTANDAYYTGTNALTENPVGSFEGHLSYDVKPRFWASLDGNFWYGGQTSLNGIGNSSTLQTSSRVGGTVAYPITAHQSLKLSYSNGAYVRFGGNFNNLSLAWQYSWVGRPN